MKKLIFSFLALLFALSLHSQAYMTAGGLRLGTDWGLTLQQRLAKRLTGEVILQSSFVRDEAMLSLLLERHVPLLVRHFNVYGGVGLHYGWGFDQPATYRNPAGVSFVGGVELTLGKINLSYDLKPAINAVGGDRFLYAQTALSVRYVLLDDKVYRERQRVKKKRKRIEEREERRENRRQNGINWRFWE